MEKGRLCLKEFFPKIARNGENAYVDFMIPTIMDEIDKEMEKEIYPCILICPGGGYASVAKREGEPIAVHLLAQGYRIFILNYSVKPYRFPQQLCEVAAAMELIYAFSEKWHIDTAKIAIMGFSAGGHLAAQYANRYNCREVREVFPESKPVWTCILGYSVLTADKAYTNMDTICNYMGYLPEDMFDDTCYCEKLVRESTPPTFLWHTAEDKVVSVKNSLVYAEALSKYGVPYELHIYPYGGHGLATVDRVTSRNLKSHIAHSKKWIGDVIAWLELMEMQTCEE